MAKFMSVTGNVADKYGRSGYYECAYEYGAAINLQWSCYLGTLCNTCIYGFRNEGMATTTSSRLSKRHRHFRGSERKEG